MVRTVKNYIKRIIVFIYQVKYFQGFLRILMPKFLIILGSSHFILELREEYLKIKLNYKSRNKGYITVNLSDLTIVRCSCRLDRLPLARESVSLIEIDNLHDDFGANLDIFLSECYRVLIPGGRVLVDKDQFLNIFSKLNSQNLNYFLRLKGYDLVKNTDKKFLMKSSLEFQKLQIYKKVAAKSKRVLNRNWQEQDIKFPVNLNYRQKHLHNIILSEARKDIFYNKKVLSIDCGRGELEILNAQFCHKLIGVDISEIAIKTANQLKDKYSVKNVQFINLDSLKLPFADNSFDSAFVVEVIEHLDLNDFKKLLEELKRVIIPSGKILFTTPNKKAYYSPGHVQFLTKEILAKIFDEANLEIRWIDIDNRRDYNGEKHNLIKALVSNNNFFVKKHKEKIFAIGAYDMSYEQLGFHWDGQKRAMCKLGYDSFFWDIRKNKNFKEIKKQFLKYNGDILWLGLSDCLPLIQWMKDDIIKYRKSGGKVIYWFCDFKKPKQQDFSKLIDFVFITNAGQIEEYKKAYRVKNVFYMPQAVLPEFMHYLPLKEKYDIAFAGNIFKGVHENRYKLLKILRDKFKVTASNKVRNRISNFYSESRLVFGANQDDVTPYLYTSNRFFVAIGCGACYFFEYFPGAEKLVENHNQAVWFKNEQEMVELASYYLEHEEERMTIRKNAQKLAHQKHSYYVRVKNIFDIIQGKVDGFDGLL